MFLGFWGITQCKVIPAEVWGDTTPPYLCVKVLLTLRMESLLSSETAVIISLRCVTCQKTNIDRQQCKMLNEGILRDCGIHTTLYTHTYISVSYKHYTVCPTRYRTRLFFNNSNTNEDIATKFEQEYVRCVRNEEECDCSPLQISLQYPH